MNRRLAAVGVLLAAAVPIAACTSSTSSSGTNGTETVYGKNTGAAAVANSPVFHLTFTGPVNTSGTTTLDGGSPVKGQSHTFTTSAGNLVLTLTSTGKNVSNNPAPLKCYATWTTTVPFTVDGAKSTGKFAHAKGGGTAVVAFAGDMPLLKNGQCDNGSNAEPVASTAVATFTGTVNLTLK